MAETLEISTEFELLHQFRRDGYMVARSLIAPFEIAEICDAFMQQGRDGPVEALSELRYSSTDAFTAADPLSFYPRMLNPHRRQDLAIGCITKQYMLDQRLKPYLEGAFEEEAVAVQSMFYFKPPGSRGQALHQDNFYLRVAPGTCMAAWIAVDDADEENGGMVIVPRTDNLDIACPGKSDAMLFFTSEQVQVPAGYNEVPIDLKAGDVLFFNGSVIHGSYPNASKDRFRRSLIFHYAPLQSQELSNWYVDPTTFDGKIVSINQASGGGPCGVEQPQPLGPH